MQGKDTAHVYSHGLQNYLLHSHVMIVEDNRLLRQLITEVLSEHYNIIEADNGKSALNMAIEHQPNLIITDIYMPYLNGLQLVEALVGNIQTRHIPVILISTEDQKVKINEGMDLGAIDYIIKPFDIDFLLRKVQNIINVISSQQAIPAHNSTTYRYIAPFHLAFSKKIDKLLKEYYRDPNFSVTDMAKGLATSERQLQRKCNDIFGYGPAKAIKVYRLNIAKDYLRSGLSVTITAELVGFYTQSYFSKCFKEVFGVTPRKFVTELSNHSTELPEQKTV